MKKLVVIIVLILIGIQFIPVNRSNPPATAELEASPEVMAVLERACYDCHSNETVWPWYAKVAPVSWQISSHVVVGRRHVNFSEWGTYDAGRQKHAAEEIWEEIENGAMPLKIYVKMHKKAVLRPVDKELLEAWTTSFAEPEAEGEIEPEENDTEEL